jgi:hypothetical protein
MSGVDMIHEEQEQIGRRTIEWTKGLPEDVRASLRMWLERYPGLFRKQYVRVAWDTYGGEPPVIALLDGDAGCPSKEVLMIVETAWYQRAPRDRERQFVFDLATCLMVRTGRLSHDAGGRLLLRMQGFEPFRDEEAVTFLEELADMLVRGAPVSA